MKRLFASLLLVASVLLPAAAMRPAQAAGDHTLVWVDGLDVNVLNPLIPGAAANNFMNSLTMAYLTFGGYGPLQPDLAQRLPSKANGGISADGKTITWQLRPNLKWSDGAPLTSADIAFSVALINDPKTNIADRTGYDNITRVDTPSPTVAVMHLAHPDGQIVLEVFSDIDAPILPKHLLAGKDVNTADYMQLPVGAGPFRYSKWARGDRVEVEANPYYHGPPPKLAKIVYKIIPNLETATAAMRTGDADFFPVATKDTVDELRSVAGIHSIVLAGARPALLMLNTKSPVMADLAVREALREGLNRASIIERSYHNGAELGESIVSKNDPEYLPVPLVPFDRAAAIAKLEAAGWKAGPDGVRVKNGRRLHVALVGGAGTSTVDQIFELIRSDWTALGVEVETRRYVPSILFGEDAATGILKGGKFDAAYFSYGQIRAATLEASYSCKNVPPAGSNYSRTCDPALDALFAPIYCRIRSGAAEVDRARDPAAAASVAAHHRRHEAQRVLYHRRARDRAENSALRSVRRAARSRRHEVTATSRGALSLSRSGRRSTTLFANTCATLSFAFAQAGVAIHSVEEARRDREIGIAEHAQTVRLREDERRPEHHAGRDAARFECRRRSGGHDFDELPGLHVAAAGFEPRERSELIGRAN